MNGKISLNKTMQNKPSHILSAQIICAVQQLFLLPYNHAKNKIHNQMIILLKQQYEMGFKHGQMDEYYTKNYSKKFKPKTNRWENN